MVSGLQARRQGKDTGRLEVESSSTYIKPKCVILNADSRQNMIDADKHKSNQPTHKLETNTQKLKKSRQGKD